MQTRAKKNIFKPKIINSVTKHPLPKSIDPTTTSQALKHPKWRAAMSSEFSALLHTGIWEIIASSVNQNLLSCKWVFRIE